MSNTNNFTTKAISVANVGFAIASVGFATWAAYNGVKLAVSVVRDVANDIKASCGKKCCHCGDDAGEVNTHKVDSSDVPENIRKSADGGEQ